MYNQKFIKSLNKYNASVKRIFLESKKPSAFYKFSGSYIVKGMSAVNQEKDLVVLKPIKDMNELSFQAERKHKKTVAKNRRPFEADLKTHLSSMDLRIKLKQFLEEDLSKCFNRLMKSTKELVSVCLPVESFHHIQVHLDSYLESAAALAKEAKIFGLRAQHALSAYKELILFHQHLLDKGSAEEKDFAKRTCYHILTVEEYREMGFVLIRKFKLSLFRIFAEVKKHFNGLTLEEMKKHRLFELYTFGYHLLKHFFTCYEKTGAKLAPEILFWKGPKECYEIENGDGDMIDFLRTNLAETHGEFSRQKIIKQISYLGVVYEKKKPTSKSYKWSEGLRTELSALKEQYSELDDEDRELIDLVDYCTRRLSEKKPKRQVKQELIALGAALKPDGKRRPSMILDRGDEESDVDLELEDGLNHQEEDDTITVSEGNAETMAESAKGFGSEETRDPGPNKELDPKEQDVDASSPASTPDHVGVDDVVELRKGLLMTCSGSSDKLKYAKVRY
ncbi:hypothetical protein TELCIR_10092 [Teladorsagia circumcincta]|uniref:Uncharacterized protein n=1 Tax=Teladorsagia circumcincta TaxID=45464 RepID=A0A2G9UEH3_TELCI|nr:hypothetical protein TELCIR_10092 [Teladorsagia circumcincta]